ncbi:triacylglycerol lipase [Ancylostoma caninum]|uniref:Triacylglycerol lipase n=1 Tax=Ancylostoma caninum TaxID=29170 RepID=A0A368F556_ANCCA|nr:triacylglycerol lipase [Ancylostoma caninum]
MGIAVLNLDSLRRMQVTGHSLGGAIASLAAHYLVGGGLVNSKDLKLITLGQPRTGDKEFAKNHTATIDYSFRVTHWRDVVPHIPSFDERPGGYYHHKTEYQIQNDYLWTAFQVFYKEGMAPNDYIVCKEYEDFKCSDGLWVHTSIKNHIKYFGKVIRDWGIAGCL